MEDKIRITFSLYTIPLLVTLIIYFKSRLGKLSGLKLLESNRVYHHQYQNRVLVLVNFQNKLIQCKLPVYILDVLPKVVIWNRDC